jgi:HlyD family secretion protein
VQIRQPNLAMIKPEMSVKANFLEKAAVSEEAPRIVIPTKAVVPEGNDYYVWTINRGMAKRVSVLRGSQTESGVEVREGLRDGDVVVVAPPASLSEGQKVQTIR